MGVKAGWSTYLDVTHGFDNTVRAVKATQGVLGGYAVYNPNNAVAYIQIFNVAAGSVVLGTTVPLFVLPVPAASGANIEFDSLIPFGTAISVASATTPGGASANASALTGTLLFA